MMETFSIVSDMGRPSGLDAAVRLRDAAELRGEFGRSFREELVQLLDGHSRFLAEGADRGRLARRQVALAHEADHLPVAVGDRIDPGLATELAGDLLRPLLRFLQEPLGVDVEVVPRD